MHRTLVTLSGSLAIVFGLEAQARADSRAQPCGEVREHVHDTVIVFEPPRTFTVCRDGAVQEGVVTGRRVYLQLASTPAAAMFDFRIHGHTGEWTPMGLAAWEELTLKIAGKLRDLDHSGESIADLVIPLDTSAPSNAPLKPVAAARTRYLSDVTSRYVDAVHEVRGDARELPIIAGVVKKWCTAVGADAPGAMQANHDLKMRCAGPELAEGAVEKVVDAFEAAAKQESLARNAAREAVTAAIAHPEDAAIVSSAVLALDAARVSAQGVVSSAHTLRESSAALSRDLATLRVALRSMDGIHAGVPFYLTTYSEAGNAELEIDATPVDMGSVDRGIAPSKAATASGRFPVFGRHYLDIEVGVGWTAGVPNVPYADAVNGVQTIQSRPVDEFVGLALVELEPLRFGWPEKPLAGVLRFPVIAIPFTRDPTQNFFVGGGLGWTEVGSVNFGPYFLREVTLRDGFSVNQPLPPGTGIGAATVAGLRVGYFFSASVDILGIFHLFVSPHTPTLDAVTGKEK